MDFQSMINAQMKALRDAEMKYSPQLTVSELIEKLSEFDRAKKVRFDAEHSPTGFQSWRGIYDELSITYEDGGGSNFSEQPLPDCEKDEFGDHDYNCKCGGRPEVSGTLKSSTVGDMIDLLKEITGKVMTGYKGGDFTVRGDTPVWVATYSNSGCNLIGDYVNTFITGAVEIEGDVFLTLQAEE